MRKIRISVMPPLIASPAIGSTSVENISAFASAAEELGFHSILLQDHIGISGAETYDCLTTLGMLAANTRRIRLGTLATPIPLRHPALVAKSLANIDIISNGRAELSVGAGWIKEDFVWYGIPYPKFKDRIGMMREGVQVIKALWTQSPANYRGEYYALNDADFRPKPIQRPHPPIWVAGVSESALKVAVDEGNGWYGWMGLEPKEFGLKVKIVDRLCREKGRSRNKVENAMHVQASIARNEKQLREQAGKWMKKPKSFHDTISCGTPEYFTDLIERYREAGCDQLSLVFVPVNKAVEQIRLFGEKVLPNFG